MKCENCQITMTLDRTESSGNACAQWLNCPLCSRTHMISHLKNDTVAQQGLAIGPGLTASGLTASGLATAARPDISLADLPDHEHAQQYSLADVTAPHTGTQLSVEPEFFMDSLLAE